MICCCRPPLEALRSPTFFAPSVACALEEVGESWGERERSLADGGGGDRRGESSPTHATNVDRRLDCFLFLFWYFRFPGQVI
jgi:hypothetical protein